MDDVKKIICYHTHLELNDYKLGECTHLERSLSVWLENYFKYKPIAYVYDEERQCLLIPSGVSANWVSSLTHRPIEMNYDADPYDKMHMRVLKMPRDELQVESLNFLAGKGKYSAYSKYPQLVLNLDTDSGKTYIAMAQMAYKGLKTVIIVHSEFLQKQWIDKLVSDTDIDPKKIMPVVGSAKCMSIINKPKKFNQYTVYIIKHDTIRSFGNNHGWNNVSKLFKAMNVGIKIYDEVHREFANIVYTDCYTNTKYTYYLTATFGRSNTDEMKIYKRCFNNVPKFEQKKLPNYGGKPHISYICVFYGTNPTMLQIANLKNSYGFNRNAYARYQLVDDDKFFTVISELVKMTVIDHKFKTMILMCTIQGIEDMADYLKAQYPDMSIGLYHSKVDPDVKAKAVECDLIISTEKSLGEGADIQGLRAVINTESFKSTIIVEQIIGRLRRPPDGSGCVYFETVDRAFQTLRNQQKTRERFLKKMVSNIRYVKM